MQAHQKEGPLAGVRVIEVGVWHAGPGAAAILGDLGATVIKVESLEGDPERYHGGFGSVEAGAPVKKDGWNILFEMSNRNKRNISLDLKRPEARGVLEDLIRTADIFITNHRQSTVAKLKLDYDSLRTVNERLVHVSISAFGDTGPLAAEGGFDTLAQAYSGMLFIANRVPTPLLLVILDQLTAITATHAAMAALVSRELHGKGQAVHASLYGSATWLQHANLLVTSLVEGAGDFSRERYEVPAFQNTFQAGDGDWMVFTSDLDKFWRPFTVAVDRPDLAEDPRFATQAQRSAANAELIAEMDELFRQRGRDEWVQILRAHGLLVAPVRTYADVVRDEQARANGFMVDFEHSLLGKVSVPGYPVRFSASQVGPRSEAGSLGQHTISVLRDLEYDETRIAELLESGAVQVPPAV